jgi:hypothetical protein
VFALDLSALGLRSDDVLEIRLRGEDRAGQFDLTEAMRVNVTGIGKSGTTPPQPPRGAPSAATQRAEPSVPLDPPGFEDPLRAYFDALRRGPAR